MEGHLTAGAAERQALSFKSVSFTGATFQVVTCTTATLAALCTPLSDHQLGNCQTRVLLGVERDGQSLESGGLRSAGLGDAFARQSFKDEPI